MKRIIYLIILFNFLSINIQSINKKRKVSSFINTHSKTLIYKTYNNYYYNIPVLMDDKKEKIISYPSPKDIYYNGELAYPTLLDNNYLLDNRGITKNVVFLDYTYEEYSQLSETPSLEELQKRIIDKYPLTELWNCGVRTQYENEEVELNELIRTGFPNCKNIIKVSPVPINP